MNQPLPQDKLAWDNPRSNRGYIKIGREYVTQSSDAAEIAELRNKPPNTKESMEIGRDWDKTWRNHWPQESDAPGFKETMLDFYQVCGKTQYIRLSSLMIIIQTCHELHTVVMRAIALGLDLDETFFDDKINEQSHNLRLLSYPPIKSSQLKEDGQARIAAHSGEFMFPSVGMRRNKQTFTRLV
jgi:isopenicillin N synthase-like dioxygenase